MTAAPAWLDSRRPAPPGDLRDRLHAGADARRPESLLDEGVEALGKARAATGRVRESAFHLLLADALLTYACEAALESQDPAGGLDRVLDALGATR